MSIIKHLPTEVVKGIALNQDWDEETIIIHLGAFIVEYGLSIELEQYLFKIAQEENGS